MTMTQEKKTLKDWALWHEVPLPNVTEPIWLIEVWPLERVLTQLQAKG